MKKLMKKLIVLVALAASATAYGATRKQCMKESAEPFYACIDLCAKEYTTDAEVVSCRRMCDRQLNIDIERCMNR